MYLIRKQKDIEVLDKIIRKQKNPKRFDKTKLSLKLHVLGIALASTLTLFGF